MPKPLLSVVVPTHDRGPGLERLLAGLREQTVGRDRFEVIVVTDGPAEAARAVLAREAARGELALRVERHAVARGPGPARNTGWRVARAPLVAFIDDDCVPTPGWLSAALGAAGGGAVVQGRTEPDPSEPDGDGLLWRTLRVQALGPQYETCNIVYPRAALEALGGFDERFGLAPGGEDTDLAWRTIEAGWSTTFAPEAVVHHAVTRVGVRGALRVAARWTATTRVFARHPGTREMLYHGMFWNVWHYLLWRSLLALAAPAWLRRMLLARHLAQLRRRARQAGAGPAAIPFLLVHDAVECWAIARGAIRYRTLVL